jgi:hypothetical protein
MTTLAIIIPVKNDARRLARCLAAIAANRRDPADATVIVADNGSSDDSPRVAAAAGARVMSLPGLRVSEMRNQAAASTEAELLAFIDADHEIVPDWIPTAVSALAGADIGAAGALYSAPENGTWVQKMYGVLRGRTKGRSEVAWLGSGNLVVRRSAFQQLGGFDPSLEACEDVDLCQRLKSAGWTIIADERLGSVHHGDPPTLAALFRAERWRGRDNLKVSLRGPLTVRDIPSVVTPIVTLAALIAIVAGSAMAVLGASQPAWFIIAVAVLTISGLAALKAMRMATRAHNLGPTFLGQAFVVSLVYDLARAIALMTRAPHHRR